MYNSYFLQCFINIQFSIKLNTMLKPYEKGVIFWFGYIPLRNVKIHAKHYEN